MIKEPKTGKAGDVFDRRTYVIRAKPELIQKVSKENNLDEQDIGHLLEPRVVTTPSVAFEEHLEGWRLALENKCKEAFLRSEYPFHCCIQLDQPAHLFSDMSVLIAFFDRYWTAEIAELVELEMDAWKTRECFPTPPVWD